MIIAEGKSIVPGIAIGKIRVYRAPEREIGEDARADVHAELARYEEAREKAQEQQRLLHEKALSQADESAAGIFAAHGILLEKDGDLSRAVAEIITSKKRGAPYAVKTAFDEQARIFAAMDDAYFQERGADIVELENALLDLLLGNGGISLAGSEPVILAARDITPSELLRLDRALLAGLVTAGGSSISHTAILARSMNLPALIQCRDFDEGWEGKTAALDGYNSCVCIEPDGDFLRRLSARQQEESGKDAGFQELQGRPDRTMDGREIKVSANISSPSEAELVLRNDAAGVGLFRSEFLYLNRRDYPTEEEQVNAYRQVLSALAPRRVVIRTCDLGGDKKADYLGLDPEENPALGFRGIRLCLAGKDFFRTQLRSLLRASAYGNLAVMFPMITSVREVKECKALLEECRQELIGEGINPRATEVGIMIETPAAVLCADELAEEVDFFSIGTNDLMQYLCAIDRQNPKLDPFLDPHHPALLRAVRISVEAAHCHHCQVGICGELASDLSLTGMFLEMGVDELSVSPSFVLPLRRQIRSLADTRGANGS